MPLVFSTDPRLEFSPVCRGLMVLNMAMYGLGVLGGALGIPGVDPESVLTGLGLFPRAVVEDGMLWTPFTYMFVHANLVHLGVNMAGLYLLGPDLEQSMGPRAFLGLYLAAGLAGGLGFLCISYVWMGLDNPVVGASGAIMGLLGAVVAVYPAREYLLVFFPIPLRVTVLAVLLFSSHVFFLLTPYGGRVAYDVHLCGGLFGFGTAWAMAAWHRRRWRRVFPASEREPACAELEALARQLAQVEDPEQADPEAWARYQWLQEGLRYEDVPSVEELRARARD